jgi:hypothetical protein
MEKRSEEFVKIQRDQQRLKLLAANDSRIFPKYEHFLGVSVGPRCKFWMSKNVGYVTGCVGKCCFGLFNGKIKNCEKFNFMEHIFNVEAHAEHTGWHLCYEVSESGTFFEKKSKVLTRDQINLLYNLPFFRSF